MIRKADIEDFDSIMSLIKVNNDTFSEVEILSSETDIKECIKNGTFFIFHISGCIPAGCCGYTECKDTNGVYTLTWLSVDPKYKRQGIATNLLNYIEGELKEKGVRILLSFAGVGEENEKFYKKSFSVSGVIPDYYRTGKGLIMYYKDLE